MKTTVKPNLCDLFHMLGEANQLATELCFEHPSEDLRWLKYFIGRSIEITADIASEIDERIKPPKYYKDLATCNLSSPLSLNNLLDLKTLTIDINTNFYGILLETEDERLKYVRYFYAQLKNYASRL